MEDVRLAYAALGAVWCVLGLFLGVGLTSWLYRPTIDKMQTHIDFLWHQLDLERRQR
jgi:hypothetical protein